VGTGTTRARVGALANYPEVFYTHSFHFLYKLNARCRSGEGFAAVPRDFTTADSQEE
jgi:hypothetical protein